MKSNGGMRGMYAAVAKAMLSMSAPVAAAPTIMDRAPEFMGVVPPVNQCRQRYSKNQAKPAFQGAQECARRRERMF